MNTAERIFDLLDRIGMEQKEFAAKIGTTDKTVSTWRTGRTKSYHKYIQRIAEVLGTSVDYLLTGEKAPEMNTAQMQRLVNAATQLPLSQFEAVLDDLEKKKPTTVSSDGQATKLAQALRDIGIDVAQLSEADVRKIAKLAKTLFEE